MRRGAENTARKGAPERASAVVLTPELDHLRKLHLADNEHLKEGNLYVFLCYVKDGDFQQRRVKMKDLETKTLELMHEHDGETIWISQNAFYSHKSLTSRREKDCYYINAAYVDVDPYHTEEYKDVPVKEVIELALKKLKEQGFPEPTNVVFSGRGFQFIWKLNRVFLSSKKRDARRRWGKVQEHLCKELAEFGSDKNALDISRIFRLAGTNNPKSNRLAKIVDEVGDGYHRYDFDWFADEVLPMTREEHNKVVQLKKAKAEQERREREEKRAKKAFRKDINGEQKLHKKQTVSGLMQTRIDEMLRLAEYRYNGRSVDVGMRDMFIFLISVSMSYISHSSKLHGRMSKIAAKLAPELTEKEIAGMISANIKRMKDAENGNTEDYEYEGKKVDPRYRYSTKRLISDLEITEDEMKGAGLRTLASPELKKAFKKRNDKAYSNEYREEVLGYREKRAAKNELHAQILELADQGMSQREISEALEIGRKKVRNALHKPKPAKVEVQAEEAVQEAQETTQEAPEAVETPVAVQPRRKLTLKPKIRKGQIIKFPVRPKPKSDPLDLPGDIPLLDEETAEISGMQKLAAGDPCPF